MARKASFREVLFNEISEKGMSSILLEIGRLLTNPNITLSDDDVESATTLRDEIRRTIQYRAVMKSTVFKSLS